MDDVFTLAVQLCDELVSLISKKLSRAFRVEEEAVNFFDISTHNLDTSIGSGNNFGGSEELNRKT